MDHEFRNDRAQLVILADAQDREDIREILEDHPDRGCDWQEAEALDSLTSNSELQWISPSATGDLTDAPMLGIVGGDNDVSREPSGPHGSIQGGADKEGEFFYPILERWAFMDYQLRTFLEDLTDKGEAIFLNSN